jgi:hypothetical protein
VGVGVEWITAFPTTEVTEKRLNIIKYQTSDASKEDETF